MGDIAEAKTMSKSIDSKENILDIEKYSKNRTEQKKSLYIALFM